jgi:hypothetical protein
VLLAGNFVIMEIGILKNRWRMPRYIFAIIFVGVALLLGYPTLKKFFTPPIDPEHLAQVPQDFRFEKVYEQDQLKASLDVIIKEGMSKDDVDAIFLQAADADSHSLEEGKVLYYKHTKTVNVFCGVIQNDQSEWKFAVQYDDGKIIPFESKTNQGVLYDALWPCF